MWWTYTDVYYDFPFCMTYCIFDAAWWPLFKILNRPFLSIYCFRYLVAGGLVERVSRHSRSLVESEVFQEQENNEAPLMVASFELLSRVCCHLNRISGLHISIQQDNQSQGASDQSTNCNNASVELQTSARNHLLGSLANTEGAGAVGVLYAALVLPGHNNQQKSSSPTPNQTSISTAYRNIAFQALNLMKNFAEMDLPKLQVSL